MGTIFQIGTDGTGYAVLHSFAGGANDGSRPQGDLTLIGSTLYGMTVAGGSSDLGTVFSLPVSVPEPSAFALVATVAAGAVARRRYLRSQVQ
jgi:uncharacterized repeat protein (TIGR03803 family)